MQSVIEKIREVEKCHCVRPRCSCKRVRFMDMKPTEFQHDSNYGVIPKEELHIITENRTSPISGVGEPECFDIETHVDSGACGTVMPTKLCSRISMIATTNSRSGFGYEVASRDGLLHMWERRALRCRRTQAQWSALCNISLHVNNMWSYALHQLSTFKM